MERIKQFKGSYREVSVRPVEIPIYDRASRCRSFTEGPDLAALIWGLRLKNVRSQDICHKRFYAIHQRAVWFGQYSFGGHQLLGPPSLVEE